MAVTLNRPTTYQLVSSRRLIVGTLEEFKPYEWPIDLNNVGSSFVSLA